MTNTQYPLGMPSFSFPCGEGWDGALIKHNSFILVNQHFTLQMFENGL